jgi:putative ABC transport system permease protein
MLHKNPGFSLAAIITLALCIGANTAIYSMLDALVFKPLPFHESDRIFEIYSRYGIALLNPSYSTDHKYKSNIRQFSDFRRNVDAFSYLAAWQTKEFNLVIGDDAIRSVGAVVTPEIFDVLDLDPVLGRLFFTKDSSRYPYPIENDPFTDAKEVVLTQSFWESYFQGDPGVIGRSIQVEGGADTVVGGVFTVIGVVPKTLESFDAQPRFIIPQPRLLGSGRWEPTHTLLGRLKPDATIGAATGQMTALQRQAFDNEHPSIQEYMDRNKISIGMDTLQSSRVDPELRFKLYLFQGAALFVLLIGCVNIANLLLARSNARQGEMAIRIALGSGRRAIARQLLVESFLLTWLGTAIGIVLATGIIEIINVYSSQLIPNSLTFAMNGRLLAFTAVIATLTSLAIGLVPVFHVFRNDLSALTQNQSLRLSGSRSLRTMSSGLVVAQMAITLVLLIGGGLLIHSFANILVVDTGFNPRQIAAASIDFPNKYRYRDNQGLKFSRQLEEKLREIPGFESVSLVTTTPYTAEVYRHTTFKLQDYKQPSLIGGNPSSAYIFSVDASYLETMQIPLIEGRWFNAGDTGESGPVCVVSRDFVRQYVSDNNALGKHFTEIWNIPEEDWPEIVGVVDSVRDLSLEERFGSTSLPAVYYPIQQTGPRPGARLNGISVLIRSPRPTPEVVTLIREKVREIDPTLSIYQAGSMEDIISSYFIERRAIMLLLCSFAGLALLLSAVGIYGVLAYDVSKRTHEIGIRRSIGATDRQITRMILRQGLWRAGIGLAIGLAGAFYLSRFMSSLLFGVQPTDPFAYVSVSVLLLLVALLASYLPARRAARIDPIIALRSE